jgi:hypothetical protein
MTVLSRSLATAIALTLGLIPVMAGPAHAADSNPAITWSVTPSAATGKDGRASFSYSVKSGVEITDYVAISNQGTTSTTFNLYATDAINDPKNGAFSLLPSNKPPVDLGAWATMPVKKVTVAPGTQARVPVTILVPSDATPGDHTAGIIASIYKLGPKTHGRQIRLEERVAARVYLHVAGAVAASVAATGLTSGFAPSLNPFGGGDASINYSVKNTGNLRVDVLQKATITGPFGIVLAHATGSPIRNVLPGQSVQEQLRAPGIPPLLLLWSTVRLTTESPTDTTQAASTFSDAGTVAPVLEVPKYPTFSSDSLTGAVPWMLLLVIAVIAAGIWVLVRYLGASRDRVYLAIDAAASEAREKALASKDESREELDAAKMPETVS